MQCGAAACAIYAAFFSNAREFEFFPRSHGESRGARREQKQERAQVPPSVWHAAHTRKRSVRSAGRCVALRGAVAIETNGVESARECSARACARSRSAARFPVRATHVARAAPSICERALAQQRGRRAQDAEVAAKQRAQCQKGTQRKVGFAQCASMHKRRVREPARKVHVRVGGKHGHPRESH